MPSNASADGPADTAAGDHVDLTSSPLSLHRAVHARRAEYVRPHRMRVKIGSWNVAACPGTDKDLANWFVDGKGIDKRLATLDVSRNPAIEREDTADSLDEDPNAVRLVGGDKIGLYVLGLQEVEDLNAATQYVARAVYSTAGLGAMDKWKMALEAALPRGYQLVASEQLSGLLLLMYASPDVAPSISNVSLSTVGTGLLGYMGNKGAVAARIVLGETTRMTFVNCHLASGHDAAYLERRIWDVGQILSRTQFKPVTHPGLPDAEPEKIGDEDFAFWFGDLNFRLDGLPGDDIRRLLMLHTKGEYDLSKQPRETPALNGEDPIVLRTSESSDDQTDHDGSSTKTQSTADRAGDDSPVSLPDPDEFLPDPADDPASLQATLDSLLPHDQLRRLMKEGKMFHEGWREGPITFLPSYKYDVGTVGLFDTSEKKRAPSWCDRILYRTRRDREDYEKRIKEAEEARRKDDDMTSRGLGQATDDDEVLFDYDPENDGDEPQPSKSSNSNLYDYDEYDEGQDDQGEDVVTKDGFHDHIHLDIYTSHQRVQSSDHKPIISVFTLEYDAAVPDLKAKVHADVARELDRAENEGRPGITIVMDSSDRDDRSTKRSESDVTDDAVNFGEVFLLRKKTCSMTIANTGRVPARFSFVEKPTTEEHASSSDPQWLTTCFLRTDLGEQVGEAEAVDLGKEVTLEPGETVKAAVEILVDDIDHAARLNNGQASLEDVLVLRVAEGRDHFIPVRAAWMDTCIGRSIDELIRVPDGGIRAFVRELAEKKAMEKGNQGKSRVGSVPYEQEVRCAAPKELFKLTEAVETLTERALADEQMLQSCELPTSKPEWPFVEPKSHSDPHRTDLVASVINALDQDKAIAEAFQPEVPTAERLEAVTEVLLMFIRGLTDGIIPIPLWTRIEQASLPSLAPGNNSGGSVGLNQAQVEDDKAAVLDIMAAAPNHNISFVFLTSTLAKVLAELSPLSKADMEAVKAASAVARSPVALTRRSISFRRPPGDSGTAEALAALEKRQAKERRFAEVLVRAGVCRASSPATAKDREKKMLEEKQRALLELFLRRSRDELQ